MDFVAENSAVIGAVGVGMLVSLVFVNLGAATNEKNAEIIYSPKLNKLLSLKDEVIVDMLSTAGSKNESWVITDPEMPDNPIIFASSAFCQMTGYSKEEIEGRNCRFLQGKNTDQTDTQKIRNAIRTESEVSVCIVNYRKDGSPFFNQFFITPLFDDSKKLAYFLGVQKRVDRPGGGQQDKNLG